jgi:hypothetical protein
MPCGIPFDVWQSMASGVRKSFRKILHARMVVCERFGRPLAAITRCSIDTESDVSLTGVGASFGGGVGSITRNRDEALSIVIQSRRTNSWSGSLP